MKGRTQISEIQVFSTDQARSGQLTSSKSAHKILEIQVSLMKGRTQISEIQVSPMKGRPGQLTSSKSARKYWKSRCFPLTRLDLDNWPVANPHIKFWKYRCLQWRGGLNNSPVVNPHAKLHISPLTRWHHSPLSPTILSRWETVSRLVWAVV